MKAKKVYEFIQKKSLRNSIKDDDIGIKYKIKQEIDTLMQKYIEIMDYPLEYIIDDSDMTLIIKGAIWITDDTLFLLEKIERLYIPAGLYFNLSKKDKLTKLPSKYLRFGSGDLDLGYTKVKKLPDILLLDKGSLRINNTHINQLPEKLKVYSLDISDTRIEKLPNDLEIKGSLFADHSFIKELPENLTIDILNVKWCKNLKKLPKHLTVKKLYISYGLEELSDYLIVKNSLYLTDSDVKKIGKNTIINGDLKIIRTEIKELPENLIVNGDLYLNELVKILPDSLIVKGTIYRIGKNDVYKKN